MSTDLRRSSLLTATSTMVFLLFLSFLAACAYVPAVVAAKHPKRAACSASIPELFKRVSPSVVYITATTINPYQLSDRVSHIVGTGFIYDPSGLILTNSHVAFGRQSIMVTLDDGTSVSAQLVGADPIFDVAVLRIPQPQRGTLLTAVLGDSDRVHIGEEVLAIGNPLGLDQSVTRGIVSAMNRILPETPFSLEEPLIQTDAPINPGNSGGPLLNRCGEVIGISTAIIADAANISFAIPVNLAKAVLPSLLAHGRVIRPWIGFHGQLIDGELLNLFRIPLAEGLLVEAVEPDSPAEHAGLRGGQIEVAIAERDFLIGGDIVLSINDIRLDTPEKLNNVMRALQVGSTVTLKVFRDGKDLEIQYVLPERPILPADIARQRSSSTLAGRTIQRVAPRDWPMRRR
jgi:S1-C subfamily serine protease